MNTDSPHDGPVLPPEMLQKLQAVLRHERRVRLQTGLLRVCAIIISAMLLMMGLDWLTATPAGPWRWIMTLSTLAGAVAALVYWCILPLLRPSSITDAARQVDEANPSLEERAQTLTGFARSKDSPELRGSPAMLRKVTQQTAAMSGGVVPSRVISKSALVRAGQYFGAAAAVLALFFLVDFQRAKILSERFFAPGSDISLTQLHATTGDLVVGKGEKLTLEFSATGKPTDYATLTMKSAGGRSEAITLAKSAAPTPAAQQPEKFTYAVTAAAESFQYRARSGDGQTAWHTVRVVERPSLSQAEMKIISPVYSHIPEVDDKVLPSRVRALEGSKMELSLQADQPLASLDLQFADGKLRHLTLGADSRYHFDTVLTNTIAFQPILMSTNHLDNQNRPNCEILVYPDLPPTVRVLSPENSVSARPNDTLQIEFEARDDFGLTKAELVVNVNNDKGSNSTVVFPINLASNEVGARLIRRTVDLDLSQFNLKQDQELTYNIRVTDNRNTTSLSTPAPEANPNRATDASLLAASQNGAAPTNNLRGTTATNTAPTQSGAPNLAQSSPAQNAAPNQTNRQEIAQNFPGQNAAQSQTGAQNPNQIPTGQDPRQELASRQNANNAGQNPGPAQANRQSQAQNTPGQNENQPNGTRGSSPLPPQNQPGQPSEQTNSLAQNTPQTQSGRESSVRISSSQNSPQNQGSQQNNAQNSQAQNSPQDNSGQQAQSPSGTQQQQPPNQSDNQENASNQGTNSSPQQSHIAMQAGTNSQNSANSPAGSQPPPNSMTQRALDVPGQTTAGQQMRVKVDEFADSFNSQQRQKQELAIDPTLKLLDALLAKAHNLTETTITAAHSKEGLGSAQSPALEDDKDQVRQASRAVNELKKITTGTAYAFIGLQISDIGDTHISPAGEELGEVALEPAKAKADLDNLQQASAHIIEARKMLASLTQSYDSVKRDNQLADAMQHLKKMHQIFLEDTQAMLGGSKPPLNSVDRKVAEVSDDYVAQLNKLMEEQKKIMAELAKILADDPRLLRRFMAQSQSDARSLRDQLTLLDQRQEALTKQTAEWVVADEPQRPALAARDLAAQGAGQEEVSILTAKMHENMITWLPTGVDQEQEPVATALKTAAEASRLAAESSVQAATTNSLAASLDSARKALDQFRFLHEYLPALSDSEVNGKNLSVYAANRLNETADLITKESGWVRKMEALRVGNFPQAAEVDQHQIALDTTTLGEKLDAAVAPVLGLSTEIHAKADQLVHTVQKQLVPEESRAGDALGRSLLTDAANRQAGAATAFTDAGKQFDELLRLLAEKMDAAPPPNQPDRNPTLDEMLAMLKEEQKTAESLGLPNRPLNVEVMRDWLRPSPGQQASGQGQRQGQPPPRGGQPPPGQRQGQQRQLDAQARAREQQAREEAQRAQRLAEQIREAARLRAGEIAEHVQPGSGTAGAAKPPANAWNTLASELGDELRQSRDNVPPEQYRQAIEKYFNTISETVPPAAPPSK